MERPEIVTDDHLEWLDDLREEGSINMFGARPGLAGAFGLDKNESSEILRYWMEWDHRRNQPRFLRPVPSGLEK